MSVCLCVHGHRNALGQFAAAAQARLGRVSLCGGGESQRHTAGLAASSAAFSVHYQYQSEQSIDALYRSARPPVTV